MKRITITIPEGEYTYIKDLSIKEGRSVSNQITVAIRSYLQGRSNIGGSTCQSEKEGDQRALR